MNTTIHSQLIEKQHIISDTYKGPGSIVTITATPQISEETIDVVVGDNETINKLIIMASAVKLTTTGLPTREIIGAYLSSILAFVPNMLPIISESLEKYGFKIETHSESDVSALPVLGPYLGLTKQARSTYIGYSPSIQELSVGLGIYLLLPFKKLNENSYQQWMTTRASSFHAVANSSVIGFFRINTIPKLINCQTIHGFIAPKFEFRKELFNYISVEGIKMRSMYHPVLKICLRLTMWTEMTHFALIDKWITKANPFLFLWPKLESQFRILLDVYSQLEGIDPQDIPYFKILNDDDKTGFLNSSKLKLLTYVAAKIGGELEASLVNYKPGQITKMMEDTAREALEIITKSNLLLKKAVVTQVKDTYDDPSAVLSILSTSHTTMPLSGMPGTI